MKRFIGTILRILVAAVGLTYVVSSLEWSDSIDLPAGYADSTGQVITETAQRFIIVDDSPDRYDIQVDTDQTVSIPVADLGTSEGPMLRRGVLTTLSEAEVRWIILGILIQTPIYFMQAKRWSVLMQCRELQVPFFSVFRLHMAGAFFNCFMPGMTGGDVMKAYYAGRTAEKRGVAIMSVVIDRFIGLFALIFLGSAVGVFLMEDEASREAAINTWIILVIAILGCTIYFSNTFRKWFGISRVLNRLPETSLLRKVDAMVVAYRHHKATVVGALALSVGTHSLLVISSAFSGWAVGMPTTLTVLMAVLPLVFLIGALPLSFMGFGVIEPAGIALLAVDGGATASQVVIMLVLVRTYQAMFALIGAWFVMTGHLHFHSLEESTTPSTTPVAG